MVFFLQTQKALSEQARKAMFSIFSLFDMVSLNVSEKLKMFDAMISPILNYGSEIWGFHKSVDIERLHLKFLKLILHVKPQTMDYIVYGELGRVPMAIIRKIRILKYWTRIIQDKDSLMYKLFSCKDCNGNYINPWTINVQNLFNDIGFAYIFENQAISQIELSHVKKRLYDNYLQKWSNNISVLSKSESYCMYKNYNDLCIEKYLINVTNVKHRITLSRFRCSSHNLMIEEGKIRKLERNQRLCTHCNMNVVENEFHFLLVCPLYRQLRCEYLPRYYCRWPSLTKFRLIMGSKQNSIISKLAAFIYKAMEKRKGHD